MYLDNFKRPRTDNRLLPMQIIKTIEHEYDNLAKQAVIKALKDKCDMHVEINCVGDFLNALDDLRRAGYLIRFEVTETKDSLLARRHGEFKLFKIDGGMVM